MTKTDQEKLLEVELKKQEEYKEKAEAFKKGFRALEKKTGMTFIPELRYREQSIDCGMTIVPVVKEEK